MYLCLGTMCAQEGQQRLSDPVSLEPQLGVSCYVVLRSSGPLEEQAKLFVTVFSLQLSASFFFYWKSKRPVSEPQERRLQAVSRLLELRDQELWLAERYAMYVRLLSL